VPNDLTLVDADRDDGLLNQRIGQLLLKGRTAFGKEASDLMVTTDVLSALEYVDRDRIGAIGHSAGGHVLVFFMFADPRVKVGVSSCGLFSVLKFYSDAAPKKRMAGFALPGLTNVGDSGDYLAMIAPRPMLLTRGLWEWGRDAEEGRFSREHVQETRDMESRARKVYTQRESSENLMFIYFEEDGGNHSFPPHVRQEAYDLIGHHLKVSGQK
jgi:hypothetical protein